MAKLSKNDIIVIKKAVETAVLNIDQDIFALSQIQVFIISRLLQNGLTYFYGGMPKADYLSLKDKMIKGLEASK